MSSLKEVFTMHAIEFDTVSKDGVIVIPQQYQEELKNRENIRLVVMYDLPQHKKNPQNSQANKELATLEKLFVNSRNKIMATRKRVIDTINP
jgi:hypothetical protein